MADAERGPIGVSVRSLAEGPARPVRVVILHALGTDCVEAMPSEGEHPVGALAPEGADDALTGGVDPGRSDGWR